MLGIQYLTAVSVAGGLGDLLSAKHTAEYFKGDEVPVFEFVMDFARNHHAVPTLTTLKQKFPSVEWVDAPEPASFYAEQVDNRFLHTLYNVGLNQMATKLKAKDIDGATNDLSEILRRVKSTRMRYTVSDYGTDGASQVLGAYVSTMKGDDEFMPLPFGWDEFDAMSGGLVAGDFASIVGRPAQGKTWLTLYGARHMWKVCKRNIMVVSMEMNPLSISQRLAAMDAQVPIKNIKTTSMTTKELNKLKGAFEVNGQLENHLWVVDGNLNAMVDDLWALVQTLRPDALYIDGAYLLKHPNSRLNKFDRVGENAEALKQLALTESTRVICSYQMNREAAKKKGKKGERAGLEDIAYADQIGQVSSLVLGLMQEDSVETLVSREVDVLKGRDGQTGQFRINWDFKNMDFSQLPSPKPGQEDSFNQQQVAQLVIE